MPSFLQCNLFWGKCVRVLWLCVFRHLVRYKCLLLWNHNVQQCKSHKIHIRRKIVYTICIRQIALYVLWQCGKLNIKSDQNAVAQDIYHLIFLLFVSRKLQLSSVAIVSCPHQLQSRGVSPCIVTHTEDMTEVHFVAGSTESAAAERERHKSL